MLLGLLPHLFLFLRSSRDGNVKWVTLFILEKRMKMTDLFYFFVNWAYLPSPIPQRKTKTQNKTKQITNKWKSYSIKNISGNHRFFAVLKMDKHDTKIINSCKRSLLTYFSNIPDPFKLVLLWKSETKKKQVCLNKIIMGCLLPLRGQWRPGSRTARRPRFGRSVHQHADTNVVDGKMAFIGR